MDDLQLRELLADAARTTPAEPNPVRAVLGRRRRARLRAAGWTAGALLVLGVAAVTVDLSGLRDTPAPVSTAVPATVKATIDDVVADALPGFPGVEVGESGWARLPGENIHNGYSASVINSDVWLQITVQHVRDEIASSEMETPEVSVWHEEAWVDGIKTSFRAPHARARYDDGRIVDVGLSPMSATSSVDAISDEALAQIAGDPRLATIPLPDLP